MIQLTGVASRYVGYYIAGFLILLGLFPSVGLIFSLMPEPVLGGATLLMFGTVASAGIRIIAAQKINRKATLVIALSFALGLSVEMVPEILCQFPESIKNISHPALQQVELLPSFKCTDTDERVKTSNFLINWN